jgi:hypothetical protein
MEKISSLLNISSLEVKREESQYEQILDPHVNDVVNKIFLVFYANCVGFDSQFKDTQKLSLVKSEWVNEFSKIGFNSLNKVQRGIDKTRSHSPINIPRLAEFISWCKPSPEDLDLWTKDQAYKRVFPILRKEHLLMSDEQSAIINHAIKETGIYDLKNHSESKTKPIFERNYEISVRDFLAGKLKTIPKALEDQRAEILELSKQEEVKKKYAHLTGYTDCMPEIRMILGMNSDGTINQG